MSITSYLPTEVASFIDAFGFPLALGAVAGLAFSWIGRLYRHFRERGQERMGLYLASALQQWTFLVLLTSPYWLLDVILGGRPLAFHLEELRLVATPIPEQMVYWSTGLLLAMTATAWITGALQEALKIPPTRTRLLLQPGTSAETTVWCLVVSPTAGICEEILFRSMLVPFAIGATGDPWLGAAAASLVFGIVHFQQGLTGILATAVMGAILAAGMIFSGSIWPCIVAHALYNMAVPILYRLEEALPEPT